MLTNHGFVLISSASLVLFLSYFLNLPWIYIISLIVIFLLFFDGIVFYLNKRRLSKLLIKRVYGEYVIQGELFEVKVVLENKNKSKVQYLLIKNEVPYGFEFYNGSLVFFGIINQGISSFSYNLIPRQTGLHDLGKVEILLYDPLMLFCYKKHYKEKDNVKVIPKVSRFPRIPLIGNMLNILSTHARKRKGLGFDFYSIKEYEYGDEIKNIAWKAVALSPERKLYTIQRIEELRSKFVLLIDVSKSMNEGIEKYRKIDIVASQILSFANFVLSNGDEVSLILFSKDYFKEIEARRKEEILNIAKAFSDIYPSREKDFEYVFSEIRKRYLGKEQIVIITDFNLNEKDICYLRELSLQYDISLIVFEMHNFVPHDPILKVLIDHQSRYCVLIENTLRKLKMKNYFVYNDNLIYPLLKIYLIQKISNVTV